MVEQLLASGRAYRCYASPDELTEMREKARREGRTKLYDGRWRDRDPAEAPPGVKPVIRLKAPLTGETVIEDQVQGRVVWQNENLDDLVLLRSDGNPTYMLAVVVDDHDMGVTHIIRGDDHLTNAARQKQIYEALGWNVPVMAHIPLIHGPDGSKLSKRHGALGRRCLPRHGLPAGRDAQLPGAARLEPRRPGDLLDRGDDRGLRPAADRPLAGALRLRQARKPQRPLHARQTSDADLLAEIERLLPHIAQGEELAAQADARSWTAKLLAAMPQPQGAGQDADRTDRGRPLPLCRPAARARRQGGRPADGRGARPDRRLVPELAAVDPWTAEATEQAVRAYRRRQGVKLGAVAQPLRAALTGRTTSPGIFDVLAVLGKQESLARLADQAR